ncbi:MAG TPA: site-2 protease family protein [Jiangellales bacterium]|nr:site-2 protease family protein [Jiangellales bacterium]
MREHIRLGRVAGIDVGINWSVLAIFLLITLGLAAGRFPLLVPGLAPVAYLTAGLVAGLIFFLSLLAHELAHALVAQRNGVEVEGITLWLFGGVARLKGDAPDPGAELRISGVGPLVSLALGGLFFVVRAVSAALGLHALVVDVFTWLSLINVVLAVFNLVPAAPLDGGRILRAILWHRRGDRTGSAITAARAGKGFGWLLVVVGFVFLLLVPGLSGLWLMFVGWFLIAAARAEEQQAELSGVLADVRVREVMSPHPTTAPASVSVQQFLDGYVFPYRYSTFPLTEDDGTLAGLVSLKRVKAVPAEDRWRVAVRGVACPIDDVPIVAPDDSVVDVLPRMADCADGRALVVEGGRLVGIVSPTDVMRQLEIAELRHHPARAHHL